MNSRNICNFYILICCFHTILWVFPNSQVRIAIIVLYLLLPVYYFFQINITKTSKYIKALNILFILLATYGLFLLISGVKISSIKSDDVRNITYLLNVCSSLLPFYAFYIFAKKGALTENSIRLWTLVFFVIAIWAYRHNQTVLLEETMTGRFTRDEITNNLGYSILALIPLTVFFAKKPIVQHALLASCVLFIMMSMKRGAILICIICVGYCILHNFKTHRNKRFNFRMLLLSVVFITAIFFITTNLLNSSNLFNVRLQMTLEGNVNSRDEIASMMLKHLWNDASALELLFGGGAYNTLITTGRLAHNDWLEIAMNQGLLGIIVYVIYWITLIKTWFKTRSNQVYSHGIALFIIIFFTKTFFSMSYESIDFYSMLVLGYCMAFIDNKFYLSTVDSNNEPLYIRR